MNKSILGQKSFASQAQTATRIGSKPLVRAITMALLAGSAAVPVWAAESATTECVPATYSETTGALVIPYVDVAQPDGNFKLYTANLPKLADQNGFAVSDNDLALKGESNTHDPCHGTFGGGELYLPYVKLMSNTDAVFEAMLAFSADNPEVLYPTQVRARQKDVVFGGEPSSSSKDDVSNYTWNIVEVKGDLTISEPGDLQEVLHDLLQTQSVLGDSPLMLSVSGNLVVDKGVELTANVPVYFKAPSILIEESASVAAHKGFFVESNSFTQLGEVSTSPEVAKRLRAKGTNGLDGTSGPNGAAGQDAKCRTFKIDSPTGGSGGSAGAIGGDASNGGDVIMLVKEFYGLLDGINASGGNGGKGGNGGSGGKGGNGVGCTFGSKNGAGGGNGGNGGNGGKGGDGGRINIRYCYDYSMGLPLPYQTIAGGIGGPAGQGGSGGAGGSRSGSNGSNGGNGAPGAVGKQGSFVFQQLPLNLSVCQANSPLVGKAQITDGSKVSTIANSSSLVLKPITITTARYGKNNSYCDATTVFKQQCDGKSSCAVAVGNQLCGDPLYGVVKNAEITYSCKGVSQVSTITENNTASLNCNQTRPAVSLIGIL